MNKLEEKPREVIDIRMYNFSWNSSTRILYARVILVDMNAYVFKMCDNKKVLCVGGR